MKYSSKDKINGSLYINFAMFDIVRLYYSAYYDSCSLATQLFPQLWASLLQIFAHCVNEKSNPSKGILVPLTVETFVNVKA